MQSAVTGYGHYLFRYNHRYFPIMAVSVLALTAMMAGSQTIWLAPNQVMFSRNVPIEVTLCVVYASVGQSIPLLLAIGSIPQSATVAARTKLTRYFDTNIHSDSADPAAAKQQVRLVRNLT